MKVINGRYENRYRSSFVGFAPSRDPQLLVLVMVDDPRSPDGRRPYGGTVAGPIAKEIFAESLPYLLK
ncbi:MAG: penicillin-binding transpeptidase domain-containing protein [Planctomycetota bacterium]|jgi:cell division protein FtsI (penicillin-binding protein 3)